jgi:hypothetical protein
MNGGMEGTGKPFDGLSESEERRPAVERVAERLAEWGIVEVIGDFRGAKIEQTHRIQPAIVTHVKRRPSFTDECLDCGPSPHVCPDDHTIAVCLRCGRDRWL